MARPPRPSRPAHRRATRRARNPPPPADSGTPTARRSTDSPGGEEAHLRDRRPLREARLVLRTLAHPRRAPAQPARRSRSDSPARRTGLTRAQAEAAFRRLQDEEERAPRPARGAVVPTVDDVTDSLRKKLRLRGLRRSYLAGLRVDAARAHLPAPRQQPVSESRPPHIEPMASAMLDRGLAPKTVRNVMTFLHSIFEHAIDRRLIQREPRPPGHPPRPPAPGRRQPRPAVPHRRGARRRDPRDPGRGRPPPAGTDSSRPARARAAAAARRSGPVLRVLILVAALTGLRQSELLGLRWRDIDWVAQRIRVRNTFVRGEHSSDGKSDLSTRRSVPMADRARRRLERGRSAPPTAPTTTSSSPTRRRASRSTAAR